MACLHWYLLAHSVAAVAVVHAAAGAVEAMAVGGDLAAVAGFHQVVAAASAAAALLAAGRLTHVRNHTNMKRYIANPHAITRFIRNLWMDASDVRRNLRPDSLVRLEERVRVSETRHRGELRLCIEGGLTWQALRQGQTANDRAAELFSSLGVWNTEHNNGVLIYLLLAERRIEILADRGISSQVDKQAWQTMVDGIAHHFYQRDYEAGLAQAIEEVGAWMRKLYPVEAQQPDNPDELANAVVIL